MKLGDPAARAEGEASRGTQPVHYVAPEVAMVMLARAQHPGSRHRAMADGQGRAPSLAHLAAPALDAWGLGLTICELFAGAPIFSTNRSQEAAHLRARCDGSVHIGLGAVHPASARSFVRKLLALEPDSRASLDQMAKHAWLNGGLDTVELIVLRAQQKQGMQTHSRIEAVKDVFKHKEEEAERAKRLDEQRRRSATPRRTRSVALAGAR